MAPIYSSSNYTTTISCPQCATITSCPHTRFISINLKLPGSPGWNFGQWSCFKCDQVQPTARQLQDHLAFAHQIESTFECTFCKLGDLETITELIDHMKDCVLKQ